MFSWPKIGDKSCQSNFDKQSSDFGSNYLITTVNISLVT